MSIRCMSIGTLSAACPTDQSQMPAPKTWTTPESASVCSATPTTCSLLKASARRGLSLHPGPIGPSRFTLQHENIQCLWTCRNTTLVPGYVNRHLLRTMDLRPVLRDVVLIPPNPTYILYYYYNKSTTQETILPPSKNNI